MRSLIQLSQVNYNLNNLKDNTILKDVGYSVDLDVTFAIWERLTEAQVEFGVIVINSDGQSKEISKVSLQRSQSDKFNQLISFNFLPDSSDLCLLARSGDISLVRLGDFSFDSDQEYIVDVIGTVEPGIDAASWSPDEELLVIVSANDDILLMSANGQFDVLNEMPLRTKEFGEDQNVNVGWGSKSTQFHGKVGKQAATQPGGPSLVTTETQYKGLHDDDKQPRITWRPDSAYFSVSTLDILDDDIPARVLRMYSRASATLQATSEFTPGLSQAFSWKASPGAPSISAVQRFGNLPGSAEGDPRLDIVFFERNGLRHGEFTLKGLASKSLEEGKNVSVRELCWSCDGVVIAVLVEIDGEEVVQLYSSGNWHWYLKSEIQARNLWNKRIENVKFSSSNALELIIVTSNDFKVINFAWTIFSSSALYPGSKDLGLTTVVDGWSLKCTPLAIANVPPPMSLNQVSIKQTPLQVSFNNHTNQFAVLLPLGDICIYNYNVEVPAKVPTLVNTYKVPINTRQVAWFGNRNDSLVIISDKINSINLTTGDIEDISFSEITNFSHSLAISGRENEVLIQDKDGKIFSITRDDSIAAEELDLTFSEFCPHMKFHPGSESLIALSSNGKLKIGFLDGVKAMTINSNSLSFDITPEFLIATTSAHKAIFLSLTEVRAISNGDEGSAQKLIEELEDRRVERGSRIVTACPRAMRLILQMPRGNLETIAPRPLVLQNVKKDIDIGNYRNAFIACRKHRIDLNIIYDHDPQGFFKRLSTFVDQIPEVDHLNLFLTGLRQEDVTKSQYSKKKISGVNSNKPTKVNEICTAIRSELEKRDLVQYTQSVMTSYVRMTPPDVEASLNLLHKLKGVNTQVAEEGVKYIIFLVDSRTLFDVALGMYDFELVLMVAQHSQRDPKEYLPFLRDLQEMPQDIQRFHIDDHLKRYTKALTNLYNAGDDHLEEVIDYTQEHELYSTALELSKNNANTRKLILEIYGGYLVEKRKFKDAAIAFTLAELPKRALEAYDRAHAWQELFTLMVTLEIDQKEIVDTAYRVADDLNQRRRFQEAGRLLCDYTDDVQASVDQFIKGTEFAEAIRVCMLKKRNDLVQSFVKPNLINSQENLLEEADEMIEQLDKQMTRLKELRQMKSEAPSSYFLEETIENNPALDNVDVSSEATTAVTQFTRYTQRASTFASSAMTGSSRKSGKSKRKQAMKEASGKKGTINEENYLLSSLTRLSERVNNSLIESSKLIPYLTIYHYDDAKHELINKLEVLEKNIKEAIEYSWNEDKNNDITSNMDESTKLLWDKFQQEQSRKESIPNKPVFGLTEWKHYDMGN